MNLKKDLSVLTFGSADLKDVEKDVNYFLRSRSCEVISITFTVSSPLCYYYTVVYRIPKNSLPVL